MYRYYNANARGNNTSDCVIRAISLAEGKNWNDTYKELTNKARRKGVLLDNVEFVEDYLDSKYKRACHYSKTVREFSNEFRKGTFLVTMQSHITCIKDGVIYDTFDCGKSRMYCAWQVKKQER